MGGGDARWCDAGGKEGRGQQHQAWHAGGRVGGRAGRQGDRQGGGKCGRKEVVWIFYAIDARDGGAR